MNEPDSARPDRPWPPSTVGLWTAEPFDPADPTDAGSPNYYVGKAVWWAEQVMRADFARADQLIQATVRAGSDAEIDSLSDRAERIAARWRDRDDGLGRAWNHAIDAREDWRRAPAVMHRLLESLEADIVDPDRAPVLGIELRNLLHTRELAGHGIWLPRETGFETRSTPGAAASIIEAALPTGAVARSDLTYPPTDRGIPGADEHAPDEGAGR
ncbi:MULTISPECIES: hypothetical protein [Nocardia]|uniref:hypothetical protein n=1 Tax=Nocardia TaxID=1817 RepID=UPI000D69D4F8|nr:MULTISPECIES: hypothetical protein [Nocardia]